MTAKEATEAVQRMLADALALVRMIRHENASRDPLRPVDGLEPLIDRLSRNFGLYESIINKYCKRVFPHGQHDIQTDVFHEILTLDSRAGSAVADHVIAELRLAIGRIEAAAQGDETKVVV